MVQVRAADASDRDPLSDDFGCAADKAVGDGTWATDRSPVCGVAGLWTGARNFPRPLRGGNKVYEEQYVKMFEWSHNLKRVTDEFLGILLGVPPSTDAGS